MRQQFSNYFGVITEFSYKLLQASEENEIPAGSHIYIGRLDDFKTTVLNLLNPNQIWIIITVLR